MRLWRQQQHHTNYGPAWWFSVVYWHHDHWYHDHFKPVILITVELNRSSSVTGTCWALSPGAVLYTITFCARVFLHHEALCTGHFCRLYLHLLWPYFDWVTCQYYLWDRMFVCICPMSMSNSCKEVQQAATSHLRKIVFAGGWNLFGLTLDCMWCCVAHALQARKDWAMFVVCCQYYAASSHENMMQILRLFVTMTTPWETGKFEVVFVLTHS